MFESWFRASSRKLQNTLEARQSYVRKLISILKVILLPATFGFIGYKLLYAYRLDQLFSEINITWGFPAAGFLSATVILMMIHWGLEAKKWTILVRRNEPTTLMRAFKGVLSGAALNILTPNQLGDFVGRVIYLQHTDKIKGTLVTVIGHTAQVIMTAAFGSYSLLWIMVDKHIIGPGMFTGLVIVLLVLLAVAITCFLHIHLIAGWKAPVRIRPYLEVFRLYPRKELLQVLLISFCRYAIFTTQYYLLARLFAVEVSALQCFCCVTAIMCVQSFVPSFILIELGMRGATALWLFGLYTPQVAPVLLTTYMSWIINAMIPGLLGLFFLLKWKANA